MSRRPPRSGAPRGRPRKSGRGATRTSASETIEVVIDALGAQGDALATWAGQTLYIPGALPGEKVRVKTGFKRGDGVACQLIDVLEPATDRAAPPCEHFGRCGGCALQHLDDEPYADFKRARIKDVLAKRGFGDVAVLDPVLIGPGTRRRVTFTAHKSGPKASVLGFNARASHDVIKITSCPVLTPALQGLIAPLGELMRAMLDDGQRVRVLATDCANGFDVLIEADRQPTLAQREAVAAFVGQAQALRVGWKDGDFPAEPVAQADAPVIDVSGVAVELPLGAFLQASIAGEHAILVAIQAGVGDARRIADLYCGVGSFTLPLAGRAIVRAVDSLEAPVRAMERAAGRANLGGRVLAEVRDLDRRPLEPGELDKVDAIVFDPPRAGAEAQAHNIAACQVERVVAVSCNPATFARDARILVDGGLRLAEVLPVDQFTFSPHVELVARFQRD